jgi:hypothetical protein
MKPQMTAIGADAGKLEKGGLADEPICPARQREPDKSVNIR